MSSIEPLEGERGIPDITEDRPTAGRRALGAIAFILLCVAVIGWVAWQHLARASADDVAEQTPMRNASAEQSRQFAPVAPPLPPSVPEPEPDVEIEYGESPVAPPPEYAPPAAYQPDPYVTPEPPRVIDKTAGDLLTGLGSAVAAASQAMTPASGSLFGGSVDAGEGAPSDLSDRLDTTTFSPSRAARLPNPSMTVAQGAMIGCALQPRLVTTVPGLTSCQVTQDVYSVDGVTKLIEAGTIATGEYRANMKQGEAVIFVAWSRLRTPGHVIIDIDSLATGPLGETGLAGNVDTHFWTRFGGAVMLSLVDDAARQVGSDDATGGVNAGSQVAGDALANSINIPPTLSKNQGDRVGIYVARDLDFSTVYALEIER